MNEDTKALDQLIDDAMAEEKSLAIKADELALQSKQFAEYLAAKKHNDEKLEVLWQMVKDYMIENNLSEHENDFIKLKLTPSGKYKTDDIDKVDDTLCKITKSLDNAKIKAYQNLHGELPNGIQPTGFVLRKVLKDGNKQ